MMLTATDRGIMKSAIAQLDRAVVSELGGGPLQNQFKNLQ